VKEGRKNGGRSCIALRNSTSTSKSAIDAATSRSVLESRRTIKFPDLLGIYDRRKRGQLTLDSVNQYNSFGEWLSEIIPNLHFRVDDCRLIVHLPDLLVGESSKLKPSKLV
jgi:hypothetical protein